MILLRQALRSNFQSCLLCLLLFSSTLSDASTKYPDYVTYQATTYERFGLECIERSGLHPECARLLEVAISFEHRLARSHFFLGKYFLSQKEYARAFSELSNTLSIAPDNCEAALLLAEVYLFQGKLQLAEDKYRHYLGMMPEDARGYAGLAGVGIARGDEDMATEHLIQAFSRGFAQPQWLEAVPGWNRMKDKRHIVKIMQMGRSDDPRKEQGH